MMSLPEVTFMLNQEKKRRLSFREDLTKLINKHGRDSRSDTQDFILADYLMDCLEAFDKANRRKVFLVEEGELNPEFRYSNPFAKGGPYGH